MPFDARDPRPWLDPRSAADTKLFARGADEHFEAYRFILPGYNLRPLELSGAIGQEQIKKLPAFTAARRRNMAVFQSLFANDDRFIIAREHGKSSCFSFTVILNPAHGEDRDRIFGALREADIGFRIIRSAIVIAAARSFAVRRIRPAGFGGLARSAP